MTLTREFIQSLFAKLEEGNSSAFFAQLDDKATWTISGSADLCGTWSKAEFLKAVSIINGALKEGLTFKVNHLHIAGDIVIAEMESNSTMLNEEPYAQSYCWVLRFEGEKIIEVRAYLDTLLFQRALLNNPARKKM